MARFLLELTENGRFYGFALVDAPLWQAPLSLEAPFGLLDHQQPVVLNRTCGNTEVTMEADHAMISYLQYIKSGLSPS